MKRILLLIAAVLTAAIASIGLWTGSLVVGAATASADGPGGDAPGNPDHKVWICHVPPGNDENPRIIFVDESGWNGHDGHPDDKGPFASESEASGACPAGPPTTEPPTTTTTEPPTTTTDPPTTTTDPPTTTTDPPTTTTEPPVTTTDPAVTTTVPAVDATTVVSVPVPVTPPAPQVEAVEVTAAASADELPVTGTPSVLLVVGGLSVLLTGAFLVIVARRCGAEV